LKKSGRLPVMLQTAADTNVPISRIGVSVPRCHNDPDGARISDAGMVGLETRS